MAPYTFLENIETEVPIPENGILSRTLFSDEALKRLTMPVLAILGGKDVLLDSTQTKRRLERDVPRADVHYLPEAGHYIRDQTQTVVEFLRG